MAEKRMTCARCPRYDREARRCRENKVNPKRKSDTVAVAELLGLQALCHYNPFRDALAIGMHYPHWPTLALSQARRLRRLCPRIEIEIEEDPLQETITREEEAPTE